MQTKVPVGDELMLRDLLRTRHEREFDGRVPLPPAPAAEACFRAEYEPIVDPARCE